MLSAERESGQVWFLVSSFFFSRGEIAVLSRSIYGTVQKREGVDEERRKEDWQVGDGRSFFLCRVGEGE